MTFPYLQMPHFLDWLCTIKKVCVKFFAINFLKKESMKNGIIFAHFFTYRTHAFLAKNVFCYRNQKVRMH